MGKDYFQKRGVELLLVQCCEECNSILQHSNDDDLITRGFYVAKVLDSRYKEFLDMPDWTDDELEELGEDLRRRIKDALEVKRLTQLRILWAKLGPNFRDAD